MSQLSVEEAAKRLNFPGGRNALYKYLRAHAGFQGTVAPYSLVFGGFFVVIDGQYERGRQTVHTQTTKVTTKGLTYIAQLMNEHPPETKPTPQKKRTRRKRRTSNTKNNTGSQQKQAKQSPQTANS